MINLLNSTERPSKLDSAFLFRYDHACTYAKGGKVLDLGTGLGLGAEYIAQKGAKLVIGVDNSQKVIEYATDNLRRSNLKFMCQDVVKLIKFSTPFDLILAFELIEHLPPSQFIQFVYSVRENMKRGGVFLLSSPNKAHFTQRSTRPDNPYHTKEFTRPELHKLLKQFFPKVSIRGIKCTSQTYLRKQKLLHRQIGFKLASYVTRFKIFSQLATFLPQQLKQKFTHIDQLPQLTISDFRITRVCQSSECLLAECRLE